MIKKDYMKPAMRVMEIRHQGHILLIASVETSGLKTTPSDYDLEYDDSGGNQGYAW